MNEFTKTPLSNYLWQLAGQEADVRSDDAQLLARVSAGDAGAFAILVRRYKAMVSGVCHRVLHHTQDVEDACQVTFLVLFRKAGAIQKPDRLAAWLYGVAYRTALHVRTDVARHRTQEQEFAANIPAPPDQTDANSEWRTVLDREVQRLPDRYRVPVVLCFFQGMTHAQAAQHLKCPRATITTRLTRACHQLRQRLRRHGLTGTAIAVASTLATEGNASAPTVTPSMNSFTTLFDGSPITDHYSPRVLLLWKGMLRTMSWKPSKFVVSVLCSLFLLLSVMGWLMIELDSGADVFADTKTELSSTSNNDEGVILSGAVAGEQPILAQQKVKGVLEFPPVVVKTVPEAGQTVAAATTKEVRITFSEPMSVNNYSMVQISKDSFPKITGKLRFEDNGRTFVMPVSLEAGKTYVMWANKGKSMNFQDQQGQRAVPYLLVFATTE